MNSVHILTVDDFLLAKYCLRKLKKKLLDRNERLQENSYQFLPPEEFVYLPQTSSKTHKLIEEFRSTALIRQELKQKYAKHKQIYPGRLASLVNSQKDNSHNESIRSIHERSLASLKVLLDTKDFCIFDLILISQDRLYFIDFVQYRNNELIMYLIKGDTKVHTDYFWEAAWNVQGLKSWGISIQQCFVYILNKTRSSLFVEEHLKKSQKFMRSSITAEVIDKEFQVNKTVLPFCIHSHCKTCNSNATPSKQSNKKLASFPKRAINVVQEHIDRDHIIDFLNNLEWPLYFLDFECFHEAIPSWSVTEAWEHTPYLYSLHAMNKDLVPHKINDFLMPAGTDKRSEMAEQLIGSLSRTGSIIVYGIHMERTILRHLSRVVQHLQADFSALLPRLVDIQQLFKNFYYYHPLQKGKYTLKSIVHILTKLRYTDIEEQMGSTPFIGYYYLVHQNINIFWDEYAKLVRSNPEQYYEKIREYCDLDSVSLAYIVKTLIKKCKWQESAEIQ